MEAEPTKMPVLDDQMEGQCTNPKLKEECSCPKLEEECSGPKLEEQWTDPKWKIVSMLLLYPGTAEFPAILAEAFDWALELTGPCESDADAFMPLVRLIQTLKATDVGTLEAQYTRCFDFSASTCLYLTAHELGDSRKRGLALVALRRMLRTAGFAEDGLELPDYLPLLFEFLAAKPVEFDASDLELRISRVAHVILQALGDDNSYRNLFSVLTSYLPPAHLPDGGFAFANREAADLDELPYPLHYD